MNKKEKKIVDDEEKEGKISLLLAFFNYIRSTNSVISRRMN